MTATPIVPSPHRTLTSISRSIHSLTMVLVNNRPRLREARCPGKSTLAVATAVLWTAWHLCLSSSSWSSTTTSAGSDGGARRKEEEVRLRTERVGRVRPAVVVATFDESPFEARAEQIRAWAASVAPSAEAAAFRHERHACPRRSLSDLTDAERWPVATATRHMVTPPRGGKLQLVCCDTTAGAMSIVVHHLWAPHGARRFVEMVTAGYFNGGAGGAGAVPFMRCLAGFLCQFGLHANAEAWKHFPFGETIPDDPNWLPEGPTHRQNEAGVKRFSRGYLAYAGGGPNSRDRQLIVALDDNGPLAGGSPWEVPWGELVGDESFATLARIYTGYGEDGPPQGKLMNRGMTDEMRKEFPLLDYITACAVVDEVVDEVVDDEPNGTVTAPDAAAAGVGPVAANVTAAAAAVAAPL